MRIVQAKLIKTITADGLVEMHPEVPLGRMYLIDLDTVHEERLYNLEWQKEHTKVIGDVVVDCPCGEWHVREWLPLELLEIKADDVRHGAVRGTLG